MSEESPVITVLPKNQRRIKRVSGNANVKSIWRERVVRTTWETALKQPMQNAAWQNGQHLIDACRTLI